MLYEVITSLDKEGLKQLYKHQIKEGRLSNKGGAGLGFIDIAKKTGNKIHFHFRITSYNVCYTKLLRLKVNTRTEKLLRDAQEMTNELQENEEELRQNAEEMRATHEELEKTNSNLETQIREVENAQKRMHSLLENASEIISIYDEDMKLKYISPSYNFV